MREATMIPTLESLRQLAFRAIVGTDERMDAIEEGICDEMPEPAETPKIEVNPMRVIVCGCRDWTDIGVVEHALTLTCDDWKEIVIVHGGCPTGVDRIANDFAKEHGIAVERYSTLWEEHGNAAGPIRNRQMAQRTAQLGKAICLAFWDGTSRGTLDMIKQATLRGIPVSLVPKAGLK